MHIIIAINFIVTKHTHSLINREYEYWCVVRWSQSSHSLITTLLRQLVSRMTCPDWPLTTWRVTLLSPLFASCRSVSSSRLLIPDLVSLPVSHIKLIIMQVSLFSFHSTARQVTDVSSQSHHHHLTVNIFMTCFVCITLLRDENSLTGSCSRFSQSFLRESSDSYYSVRNISSL